MVATVSVVLMAFTLSALGSRGGAGHAKGSGNGQGQNGNGQGHRHGKSNRDGKGNGHGKGRTLLRSTLAPSLPGDPTFHGVNPGGAPWVLQRGEVRLKRNGQFPPR